MNKKTQCLLVFLVSLASPHGYALIFSLSAPDKVILVQMVSQENSPWYQHYPPLGFTRHSDVTLSKRVF